jgi:tetratricopeptide (TPR) repeat protein
MLIGITIVTAIIYARSLEYPFQFDDIINIAKFYDIRHKVFHDLFFTGPRWISYWLNTLYYPFYQFDPFVFRLGNVVIHIATGVLLFCCIVLLFKRYGTDRAKNKKNNNHKHENITSAIPYFLYTFRYLIALIASLLFLLHPVQTQTVQYVIQGQLEGLAGFSVMLMSVLFLLAVTVSGFWHAVLVLLVYSTAFLSCGTKEIAIVIPFLLLLIDWFFVARGSFASLKTRWYIHVPVMGIMFCVYIWFLKPAYLAQVFGLKLRIRNNLGNMLIQDGTGIITPWAFAISQFKVLLHYLWIFIWPVGISVDYDWYACKSFWQFDCCVPFIILLALFSYILKRLKRNKTDFFAFCGLWILVVALPRSSIIPSSELLMDYKTYCFSGIVCLLLAVGLVYLLKVFKLFFVKKIEQSNGAVPVKIAYGVACHASLLVFVFVTALTAAIGYSTYERNTVWASSMAFWENIVKNTPQKARSHNNYATALTDAGKHTQAIIELKRAISLDPLYPDPYINLAVCYSILGDIDHAIEILLQSIKMSPNYPEAFNNLGHYYMLKKDYNLAEKTFMQALKLRPYYGKAHYNLGRVYLFMNKPLQAWECFKNACTQADFDNEKGFGAYGWISFALNKYDEALAAYQKALELNPKSADYASKLGNIFIIKKDVDKALEYYQQAYMLEPLKSIYAQLLGVGYFQKSNWVLADKYFSQAIALDSGNFEAYIGQAQALIRQKRLAEAVGILRALLEKKPNERITQQANNILNALHIKVV